MYCTSPSLGLLLSDSTQVALTSDKLNLLAVVVLLQAIVFALVPVAVAAVAPDFVLPPGSFLLVLIVRPGAPSSDAPCS